ncbi:hypothetical protein [Comamonas terrae]|uniref:Uncharacterized protein n=1 Tax=Comamonas terrae TaxID=673548 RepID=A0ABW5USH3_9BURK|nr:hypothetical protein [Comamonas terrae]
MDEYYKLAATYFKEFEHRSTFPGLKTSHWYLCLLSFSCFVYFAYQTFIGELPPSEKPYWLLFISEILFLGTCWHIGIYRFKHTVRTTSEESDLKPIERLNIAKRIRLEQLFNRPSWQFAEVVEEIAKLRKLEATYRSVIDQSLVEWLERVFNPKALAVLLTLVASALTWFINWISKSDSFSLTGLLNDPSKLQLLTAISMLIAVTVFAIVATYVGLWQLFSIMPLIISAVIPVLRSDYVILNYLIRDLIRCQTMAPQTPLMQEPTPQAPTQHTAQQTGSPIDGKAFSGLVYAALAIHTAYTAWQASKHRPPK